MQEVPLVTSVATNFETSSNLLSLRARSMLECSRSIRITSKARILTRAHMKTIQGLTRRAGRGCICSCLLLLCAVNAAYAQCEPEQVLSPPTLTTVQVRTVSQSNICNMAYSAILPTSDPCVNVQWFAASFIGIPGIGTGLEVRFVYDQADFCNEIIVARSVLVLTVPQSYLDAHPAGFAISSHPQTPFGDGVTWESFQEGAAPPPLSFQGAVIPDPAGYRLDITFTGGDPTIVAIGGLIALINESNLSTQQKRSLLAALDAAGNAFEAGACNLGMNHLNAFQNKVQAQVSATDPALADTLINRAQAIIDSGCQ